MIGCGPFEVQEHTRNKLKLKAFSQFYGCRALTDRVTIWQVDEERLSRPLIETNQPEANTTSHHQVSLSDSPHLTSAAQQQSRVEDGCLMVLFNQRAKQPLDQAQAHRLSELLNPNTIEQDIRCHGDVWRRTRAQLAAKLARCVEISSSESCASHAVDLGLVQLHRITDLCPSDCQIACSSRHYIKHSHLHLSGIESTCAQGRAG